MGEWRWARVDRPAATEGMPRKPNVRPAVETRKNPPPTPRVSNSLLRR